MTLSNAAGVVTTTPTPLKVTHAVNCTAELPTLTLQLPTVVASTLLVGGYDVAAAFAKLGATLANASESPPPSSPPSPPYGTTTTLAGSGTQGFLDGDGTSAQFYRPYGVAIDPSGAFALAAVRAWPRTAPGPSRRALSQTAHPPRARPRHTPLRPLKRCSRRHTAPPACPSPPACPRPVHRRIVTTTASAVSTSPPNTGWLHVAVAVAARCRAKPREGVVDAPAIHFWGDGV